MAHKTMASWFSGRRSSSRALKDAVQNAGAVEPDRDGESPGNGGGLEPRRICCIYRMYSPRCGRFAASGSKSAPGAPGQVAAQFRFGVLAGGAVEVGQVTAGRGRSVNGPEGSEDVRVSWVKDVIP